MAEEPQIQVQKLDLFQCAVLRIMACILWRVSASAAKTDEATSARVAGVHMQMARRYGQLARVGHISDADMAQDDKP